jgi:hypothetical protein
MLGAFLERRDEQQKEQLLELFWNRANVKRELRELRKERFDLLDKIKEQEGAILRAQEQLEGLERLLTNPLAAANAMVYFQLRHLWRIGAQRLHQFANELQMQREKRERAQLQEAALAKRKRRLDAVAAKLDGLVEKQRLVEEETVRLERKLSGMPMIVRWFKGPGLRSRITGLHNGKRMLEEKVDELNDLMEKIQGEPLPELEELSIESRRLINAAVIALAQHLVLHFSEHDLASLAKLSTQRAVADMKFGDRRDCDRLVERIRERIDDLKQQRSLADEVKKRTDLLMSELKYRNETDTVPTAESVQLIYRALGGSPTSDGDLLRRASDAPLRVNVLADDYWDLVSVLR